MIRYNDIGAHYIIYHDVYILLAESRLKWLAQAVDDSSESDSKHTQL